jgi:hypothetical protein
MWPSASKGQNLLHITADFRVVVNPYNLNSALGEIESGQEILRALFIDLLHEALGCGMPATI